MIKLHWKLMNALKEYNETCVEGTSYSTKVELGQKVIDALNEEIKNRRTDEKQVTLSFLESFINMDLNIASNGEINSVPSRFEAYSIMPIKTFIEDFEFFTACNRVINHLKGKKN